jgi:hypothetical protein
VTGELEVNPEPKTWTDLNYRGAPEYVGENGGWEARVAMRNGTYVYLFTAGYDRYIGVGRSWMGTYHTPEHIATELGYRGHYDPAGLRAAVETLMAVHALLPERQPK